MSSNDADLQRAVDKVHRTSDGTEAAQRVVQDKNERKSLRQTIIGVAITICVANLVLALSNAATLWYVMHPHREYFAADNGRMIRMVPLSEPYRSPADVIDYAKRTLEQGFSLDFSNYQGQLEADRSRFTKSGFKGFIDGLQTTGILGMIKDRRMNLTSTTGTGVLVQEGSPDGVYTWIVRFPLTLKLVGQTTEMPDQRLLATVTLRRIPTLDSVDGIGVAEVVTKPL